MKRAAPLSPLALGAAAALAMLAGPAFPEPPAAGSKSVPDAIGHAWQYQPDRPAQSVGRTLTPEMIDLCMQAARDIDESLATKLTALRSRDPRQFEAQLRASRRLTALAEIKKRDPAAYDLKIVEFRVDAAVSRLATEVRKDRKTGRAADARSAEQQLESQVKLQLAFRYRARENYLCQLRELVERLERELRDEQENFDVVLANRVAELLADHPSQPVAAPDAARPPRGPEASIAPSEDVPAAADRAASPSLSAPASPPGTSGSPRSPGTSGTFRSPGRGPHHARHQTPDRLTQSVGRKLTPEMIDLCMQVARDIDESIATKLAALRGRDVRQFEARLRASRRLTALAELKKRDPTSYDLKIVELRVDTTVSRLADEARKTRKAGQIAEARSLEQQLESQAILQLAFRYRARENYLVQLRELVERLERELKDEQDDFDAALADRMAELLADPGSSRRPGDPDAADPADPARLFAIDVAARLIVPE